VTAAQRRTLGNIIAQGGCDRLTQGRNRPGTIRKSVVAELERQGLVERIVEIDEFGWPRSMYYATTAGCRAFGPEIARVS
jgi:hypothetical protein